VNLKSELIGALSRLPPQNIATVPPLRFRDRRAVLIHHRFLYTITIVRAPSWFDVVSLHICSLETLPLRLHAAQYKKTKRLLWTCFWASSPDSLNHVIHPLPPSLSLFALFLSLSRLFMWTARGCPRSHPQLGRKGLPRRRCCVEASESRAWASRSEVGSEGPGNRLRQLSRLSIGVGIHRAVLLNSGFLFIFWKKLG
jgi:hypothetical protein